MRGVFAFVGIGIPVIAGAFLVGANVASDQSDGSASAATDKELSGLRSQHIGFIFRQFFLLEDMSALDNIANGVL
jgi:ABC-type lipoprotein export system ATPase subunit